MTDNFKEIGSLFGREGAGAGFAKQTDKDRGEPVAHGWRDCPRGRVLHRYQ